MNMIMQLVLLPIIPGYSGGDKENPTYEEVCGGNTGHAEAIQIEFDPTQIPFGVLLDIFFATHNPLTRNQQGADIGTQYRSAIFYHDQKQKEMAEKKIKELDTSGKFMGKIVTEVTPFKNFYIAEDYHKNYYDNNKGAAYCNLIIDPKVHKLLEQFRDKVKEEYKN
jgi:peptide-methionine (S)-S-oxide reductase